MWHWLTFNDQLQFHDAEITDPAPNMYWYRFAVVLPPNLIVATIAFTSAHWKKTLFLMCSYRGIKVGACV